MAEREVLAIVSKRESYVVEKKEIAHLETTRVVNHYGEQR